MRKLFSIIAMLVLSVTMLMAQTRTVTGRVVSAEDGEPVIGATIIVPGTTTGTVTDADGQYSLKVPSTAKQLTISFVGMQTQTLTIKDKLNVILESDSQLLDDVMVVAFGTAKKSAFTGSAKVVDSEVLAMSQVTNVTDALSGAVPGVTLTTESGAPGQSPTIRIRGFSSLNAENDPLIIVDGAPYSGDLNNINPSDVESMTVLKDAASNALYGARGANGVIMITTKKAKAGQGATISFDAKWGSNTRAVKQYNVIKSPAQYYEMQYNAMTNYYMNRQGMSADEAWQYANKNITTTNGGTGYNIWTVPEGQMLIGQNGKINPNATLGYIKNYNGVDYLIKPDNWEDEGQRTGNRQEYNLSINGASDKGTFLLSLGYLDNEGITFGSDYNRLTARLRGDYQAKPWLKVGGSMSYSKYDRNDLDNNGSDTSTGNVWAFTSQMAPIYPMYLRNADGSIMVDDNGIEMMDYGNGMNAGYSRMFINDANPIQDNKLNTNNKEGNSFSGNGFADFTLFKGLVLTLNGSFNLNEQRRTYVYNPYYGQFDSTGGTVSKAHVRNYDYDLQQLLNYTTTIKEKNNLNVMVGHEYYVEEEYYLSASKSKMFSQNNKELAGAVIDGQSAYSYKKEYQNEGYIGRIQYDYDERIFASASLRRDASSRFHPDHRWGTFWSAGGAWILSKEEWLKGLNWLDMLKVKVSYGEQGNDRIGNYRYTDQFLISNSSGNIGTSFYSKGTNDISWEKQGNFNIGTEFDLFKRVSGSIEYYYRKTTDMLFNFTVAPSLGYSGYYDNVGDMCNYGLEFDFNVNILRNKNFQWDVNFNLSTINNRILKLHEDKKNSTFYSSDGVAYDGYTSGSYFIAEDLSIYTWRIKEYAGVDPETGESLWWKNTYATDADGKYPKDEKGNDVKNWTGREKTNKYSEADYYVTKKTTVPDVQGGFGTSIKAYGFDFAINCTYQFGGDAYDYTYSSFMASPTSSNTGHNFHADLLNSWTPQNTSSNIPRFQLDDTYSASRSTRFLTDASYLNIQNINVGYTLPRKLTQKAQISNLRVYLSCENVGYFSKRQGFDPRQTYSDDASATRYSPMRTISAGLNLQF